MTHPAFDKLGEPDTEYLCSYCTLVSQNKHYKGSQLCFVSLTETITLLQSSVIKQSSTPGQAANTTADITGTKKTTFQDSPQQNRKFNIVVYGIDEWPKGTGTPRHEHSGLDLNNVAQIITKVDENINPLSIHDLHRLGKYQEKSRRPRPILTRFSRDSY